MKIFWIELIYLLKLILLASFQFFCSAASRKLKITYVASVTSIPPWRWLLFLASGSCTAGSSQARCFILWIHVSLLWSLRTQTPGRPQLRRTGSGKCSWVLHGPKAPAVGLEATFDLQSSSSPPVSRPFLSSYCQWGASPDFLWNPGE